MILAEPIRSVAQGLGNVRERADLRSLVGVAGLAFVLATVFAVYARILGYWFFSDDFWYLRASQVAGGDFVLNSFDYTAQGPVPEFVYRPLYPVAFLLEYKAFGLSAWPYHLTSIVLHMVNTTLVWLIARKLSRRESVAFIAAFVFGLHPSYSTAIAWITSNVAVVAMVFSLSALLLFLHYLDGGPRRWLQYAASFVIVIVAMLIHPESLGTMGIMVIAYFLMQTRSVQDLRSPRFYAPIVPHLIVAVAFFGVHQYVRSQNPYQQDAFTFGPHMIRTYFGFVAYAANPYDPLAHVFLRWRALIPVFALGAAFLWMLGSRSFDVRMRLLVAVWFALAIVPLSTFTLGIQSRKLYVAGAPLALGLGMSAVAFWDWVAPRLRPFSLRALDMRYAALAAGAVLFAVALPVRTLQLTDRPHLAESTLTSLDDQDYKAMIDLVREKYPTIPEGSLLEVTGVPWTLLIFKVLDTRMVDAYLLYYDLGAVIGYPNAESMAGTTWEHNYVVHYTCPPVCGPPLPLAWIQAIQKNLGDTPTDP